jgi:serine protease Do
MIRILLLTALVLIAGCNQHAQSQEQVPETPPQRVENSELTLLQDHISESRQTAITRAVKAASPAVVSINVIEVQQVAYRDPFANFFSDPWFEQFFGRQRTRVLERQVQGMGSGFVVSHDGYIVTNDHVAGNATKITVAFPDGRTMDAQLIGTDPATDVTLIKVETDEPLPYLKLSEDGSPLVGEWAIALGNPFGLFEAAEPSVTVGVVSATGRSLQSNREGRVYRDMIQTDAAINRGNSGGPLINALGEVIGVNTAIYSQTGGSVGIGFAVPAEKVTRIIDELRQHGRVDRSYYIGLYGVDVNQRIAAALGLETAGGVLVRDVDPASPADRAGFQPYDVIVSFEGERITNQSDFAARLYDYRPGDTVRIGIRRDGRPVELRMQIGRQNG